MKGIFGKAFLVTLLFSQLPVSAMSPAAVQTIVTPGARVLINSGRQALAKVGQRIAQDPALASGSVALATTLGTASLVGAVVSNKPAQQVVTQVAKPGFKQMAKNAGTWVKDVASNKYVLIKDHKLLSSGIAAGAIVVIGGVYYFRNGLNAWVVQPVKHGAQWTYSWTVAPVASFTNKWAVQPVWNGTKFVYSYTLGPVVNFVAKPFRKAEKTEVTAEQKPEVTPAAPATEVKEEEATETKPGLMKRGMVATVSALSTANDYTFKPLWNNKYKVAAGVAGLGSAYYFRNGLNANVLQPVVKLAQANPNTAKTIGGIATAGALGAGYAYQGKWSVRHPLTWGSASAQVAQGPATKLESDIASAQSKLEEKVKQGSQSAQLWLNALNLAIEGAQLFGDDASFERLAKTVADINNL